MLKKKKKKVCVLYKKTVGNQGSKNTKHIAVLYKTMSWSFPDIENYPINTTYHEECSLS